MNIAEKMQPLYRVIGSISRGVNKGDFDWTINICSPKMLQELHLWRSPSFSFASFLWHVEMQHSYCGGRDFISLFVQRGELDIQKGVFLSIQMIFLGTELEKSQDFVLYSKTLHPWGYEKYILCRHLLDLWTKESQSCGQMIIKIELRDIVPDRSEDALHKIKLTGKEILSQNYKDMLLDEEDHDLILKVKDEEFKAHRNIMKSRCPVFKSMLSHEMLEKNSGVVDIPDCDPYAFKVFLLYIYTGELNTLDESTMLSLYFIADKYDMESLREECSAFIKESLSVSNVCDVIELALAHSDSALLDFVRKYFVSNARKIFDSVEWMQFSKENLSQANELTRIAFDKNYSRCCVHSTEDGASDLE